LQKADKDYNSTDLKNLIAWKTGKSCPSKVSNVAQRRALWDSMKNDPAPADATWTEAEEERLKKLQQEIDTIPIENTRLGRQKEEMKELLFASLQTMSAEEKERARAILEDEDGDETQFGAV
jgi:predicted GTPase